jgi:DUF2993 family protein
MRGCLTRLVVLLVLAGLFSYLALPGLVEYGIARQLQGALGAPTRPDVEVTSSFPPETLLGHIDRVRVSADQMSLQGVAFYDARADLRGVSVSVPSLLKGNPTVETQSCLLGASAPAVRINQNRACLNYLGLGGF